MGERDLEGSVDPHWIVIRDVRSIVTEYIEFGSVVFVKSRMFTDYLELTSDNNRIVWVRSQRYVGTSS